MSGVVTPSALKNIKAKLQQKVEQVSTEHKVHKELDGKKSHKLVKRFVEDVKLQGKTRVLSNHKDSIEFLELAKKIQLFAESHENIKYVDSSIKLLDEEKTNEESDERYQRIAVLKKFYDFAQVVINYSTVVVCNSKTEKEQKSEKASKPEKKNKAGNKLISNADHDVDAEAETQEQQAALARRRAQEETVSVDDNSDDEIHGDEEDSEQERDTIPKVAKKTVDVSEDEETIKHVKKAPKKMQRKGKAIASDDDEE